MRTLTVSHTSPNSHICIYQQHSVKSDSMSIVPTSDVGGNLSDYLFNRHSQLFDHLFHDPFSPLSSSTRTLPYSELSIDTDGSLKARLECNEIPEAFLFVAHLPPPVQPHQVDDGDGTPAVRITGDDDGAGWGRFNWSLNLPANAKLDQLGSSVENGVLTVVVPKVDTVASLPPPRRNNVRVVEITGSD